MDSVLKPVAATLRLLARFSTRAAGRVAWELFGRPFGSRKMRDAERDVHAKASTETVVVNGKKIAVYRWGDGRNPVLMVHGWGGRGSNYAGFIPELIKRGMTPITFDAPAHGDSGGRSTDALECAEIIRLIHSRYGPFHAVIAHSFGALSAFNAVRRGVRAGRLVSINGVCDVEYIVDDFCAQLTLPPAVRLDMRRRMEKHFAPETDIWRRLSATYDPAAFDMPILVIQDDDDQTVAPDQARRIVAAHAPRATLMTTSGWGHRKIMASAAVIESTVDFVTDGTRRVPTEPSGTPRTPGAAT